MVKTVVKNVQWSDITSYKIITPKDSRASSVASVSSENTRQIRQLLRQWIRIIAKEVYRETKEELILLFVARPVSIVMMSNVISQAIAHGMLRRMTEKKEILEKLVGQTFSLRRMNNISRRILGEIIFDTQELVNTVINHNHLQKGLEKIAWNTALSVGDDMETHLLRTIYRTQDIKKT